MARATPIAAQAGVVPTSPASWVAAFMSRVLQAWDSAGECPGSRQLFLNVDNHLSLPQSLDQPLIHAFQATVLLNERIVVARLATTLFRCQGVQGSPLAPPPPGTQVRSVQAFAPEQLAQLAGLGAGIGLAEDLQFVLGRKPPTHRSFRHLGVAAIAGWDPRGSFFPAGTGPSLAFEIGARSGPVLQPMLRESQVNFARPPA